MESAQHLVSRRRFLITTAAGTAGSLLAISTAGGAAAAAPLFGIRAQQGSEVPRNRTLIMAGLLFVIGTTLISDGISGLSSVRGRTLGRCPYALNASIPAP